MNRYKPISFYYLLVSLFLFACQTKLEKGDYMRWVENPENETIQIVLTNNLKVSCMYTPTDYILQKEINNGVLTKERVPSRRQELSNTHHFQLSYTTKDEKSILKGYGILESETKAREDHLRMNSGKESYLLLEGEKQLPSISHFINNYGMKASTELLLGFEKKTNTKNLNLVLDNKIIDTMEITFSFDLTKIPQLKNQ